MRRIFTLFAAVCVMATVQNVNAQTCTATANTGNPGNLGAGTNITTANGFTSTNQPTPFTFPSGTTNTSITSPIFFFNTAQQTINFAVQVTPANGANPTFTPTIEILSGAGATASVISCTTPQVVLNAGQATQQVFFSITPATAFPVSTNFQIRLTFATGPRDIEALTFAIETDAIRAGAGAALPVRISGFDIRKEAAGARLTWNVDAEENVVRYDVERSSNGNTFSKIGSVAAAGQRSYSYLDASNFGDGFYRIKAVDHDGKYGLSRIIKVKGGVLLRAFPQPAVSSITLEHNTAVSASRISITTQDGRLVRSIVPSVGTQQTAIDIASLQAGMYLLRFDAGNGEIETVKIVKQ